MAPCSESGHAGTLRQFFRRQIVKILVERIARIDAVLDPVEARQQHRRAGQVQIRRRVRRAELDPLRLRDWRIGRDSDCGRAIPCGVGEIHRRLESRHQPLVAIRRRVGDRGERRRMLDDSADVKQRHLAQPGVTVPGKERFVAFPERLMRVHPASRCPRRAVSA